MPSDNEPEHCLLALVGLSPAVLTETVFALCSGSSCDTPDRIIVVTTVPGRDLLHKQLFTEGGWAELVDFLAASGVETEGRLRFGPVDDCIRVVPSLDRSCALPDIQSDADNVAVADYLMETVRVLTANDEVRLTASLAGGRKSMSALLMSVMTLLGRFSDRLVHVLVDPPWEQQPDFLFPGCAGTFVNGRTGEPLDPGLARLTLAEIPFVPLRLMFERETGHAAGSYQRTVHALRSRVGPRAEGVELVLDCDDASVSVEERRIALAPLEFALLGTMAQFAKAGRSPLPDYTSLGDPVRRFGATHFRADDFGHWSHRVAESHLDPKEDFRRIFSNLRSRLREAGVPGVHIDRIVPQRGRISMDLPASDISFKNSSADRQKHHP